MNNAVEHSGALTVDASLTVTKKEILFSIINTGERFDISRPAEIPDIEEKWEGGFGLVLIRELVDSIQYEYTDGKNILTLGKKLPSKNKRK
ncbi:unnamed protein product [marine sediment metagenome]|uniref:Histidine kinase/HSP90-like ATPase domain-containing protein n=1 Tax=marine sediment metagenome TaxID=412755 RepID=X0SZV3_9ZZZZ